MYANRQQADSGVNVTQLKSYLAANLDSMKDCSHCIIHDKTEQAMKIFRAAHSDFLSPVVVCLCHAPWRHPVNCTLACD